MINAKLIRLLKTFSSQEFHEFGKFINSPIHNESSKMITFYNFLKKYYPEFNNRNLTKENIYKKLYGDVKYEDKKLRERFSDLHRLAEEYLSWIDYKKNPIAVKRHTLSQFLQRGLETDFNKKHKEIETMLYKTKIKNENYFYEQHMQLWDKRSFYDSVPLPGKRKRFYDDLSGEIDQFIMFFITKMLIYYTLMHNREGVLNYDFEYKMYEPIMKFIGENNFDNYPTIKSYYLILKLIKNEEDIDVFRKTKEYLVENADYLQTVDKKLIFTELFNHALRKSMKGKSGFEEEQLEILKLQLEYETYPDENEGWMDWGFYLNGVIIPISMGNLEWAEKFINDYSGKLNPKKKENAYSFVNALLHFAQKKYNLALQDLAKIKGVDFHYNVRIKALLSKIFFEQREYENVLTLIDSFKHYMVSNPMIPEPMSKRYINFINILHKITLLSLDLNKDEFNISKLIEEINNFSIDELTSNKSWLLEKVLELRQGHY